MANVKRVKIEGVRELKASLEALGTAVATKVGEKATRDAAKELRQLLADTAPFDPETKIKSWRRKDGTVGRASYGHLRDNIRVSKARARKETTVNYRVTTGKAFWGAFVEFGTVRMPAYPWMRPAFEVSQQRLLGVVIDGLQVGIEREAKRAARIKRGMALLGKA